MASRAPAAGKVLAATFHVLMDRNRMNLADLYQSTDDPHEKLLFVTIWLDATASAVRARLHLAEMGRDAREMAEYWRGFANGVELAQQELRALLAHIDWIEQDESGQWRVTTNHENGES
jgi:hypothetical protein